MSAADLALSRVEAIIGDIEQTMRALPFDARQSSDRQAFDILTRIERRLLSQPQSAARKATNEGAEATP